MRIDDELMAFLRRPLMCVIAAVNGEGRPFAGRGTGFHVLPDQETIDIIYSGWQWPEIEPAVRQTSRLAATFVSPSDYVTFQVKGPSTMRDIEPGDLATADRFMASARDELTSLGVAPDMISPWLTGRGAKVVRLVTREIYIQTPGANAGMLAGARLA